MARRDSKSNSISRTGVRRRRAPRNIRHVDSAEGSRVEKDGLHRHAIPPSMDLMDDSANVQPTSRIGTLARFLRGLCTVWPSTARERIAVFADFVTIKDFVFSFKGIGMAGAFAAAALLPSSTKMPSYEITSTVADAIDGICTREVLLKTLRDGTFAKFGAEFAIGKRQECKTRRTQQYLNPSEERDVL